MRTQQRVSVNANYEINDSEDRREHERLQEEYDNLLRTLEATNESNKRLIERLVRW